MIYIVIFLVANAIGVIAGYMASKKNLDDSVNGYLHMLNSEDEEQPYIFLELKNEDEINKILKMQYALLKIIKD